MADYTKDDKGIIHICSPMGDGEFTFCSREHAVSDGDDEEFAGEKAKGPANCKQCHDAIQEIKASTRGARWVSPLIDPDNIEPQDDEEDQSDG